ncbi:MAG TPA: ABC transporter ATP-binding protein, partial [Gordonia polyisoprenivorans]|nr:ABC transporter ATP-binding protein [Gordonia polyisoprenivorans]
GVSPPIGTIALHDQQQVTDAAARVNSNGEVLVGIRPEHLEDAHLIDTDTLSRGRTFTVGIDVLESMGSDNYAYFRIDSQGPANDALAELSADSGATLGGGEMIARLSPESQIRRGSTAELYFDPTKITVFDQQSGASLRGAPANSVAGGPALSKG